MSLYKIFILIVLAFYSMSCGGDNNKNPFKTSGQCDDDIYTYSKEDLADEEFGKIGVASNTKEYPRAGIKLVATYNNGRMLNIEASFASLCKSSIIDKVKIELHNNRGKIKTYYPNITSGYSGDISFRTNVNKDQETRCFFNDTTVIFKTWARDENGNTYYAHKYLQSPKFNTGSNLNWGTRYKYNYRTEQKDIIDVTYTRYETEQKDEDREVLGVAYTYTYEYRYKYFYESKSNMKITYKYPVEMSIYTDINEDNDYPGEYFEILVKVPELGIEKRYPISNDKIQVDFSLDENSKMKAGNSYNMQVSFVEKLKNCTIESRLRTNYIFIPNESIESTEDRKFISTKKTLKNTTKTFVDRERKD